VGIGNQNATEVPTQTPIPATGTLRNLYARLNAITGNPNATVTATVRVNGVSTALTCSGTRGNTAGPVACSDTTNSVAVIAGDTISLIFVVAGTNVGAASWGVEIQQ
jgi:hypothetical protein